MRRPLFGLLLASTFLGSTLLPARTALAEPPLAPLAPSAAPATAPPWAAPLAGTRRRSSGAMAGGIVMVSLGAVAMAAGTGAYVDAVASCHKPVSGETFHIGCDYADSKLASMTALLIGATSAAFGVPLWIYGAEKVAATPEDQAPTPTASVVIGPAAATLHITF